MKIPFLSSLMFVVAVIFGLSFFIIKKDTNSIITKTMVIKAEAANKDAVVETVEPVENEKATDSVEKTEETNYYQDLLVEYNKVNSDIKAIIVSSNENIVQPIAFSNDDRYLNKAFDGSKNSLGTIYSRNGVDSKVFWGHNVKMSHKDTQMRFVSDMGKDAEYFNELNSFNVYYIDGTVKVLNSKAVVSSKDNGKQDDPAVCADIFLDNKDVLVGNTDGLDIKNTYVFGTCCYNYGNVNAHVYLLLTEE